MEFILREPDVNASAVWIRRASINKGFSYRVSVNDQGGKRSVVNWQIYETKGRLKAKDIILFIGDGLYVAHHRGARILSKNETEGKP